MKIYKALCILLAVAALTSCGSSKPQFVENQSKEAAVSAEQPFEDKLKFPVDEQGVTLSVNMNFDEAQNILTLTLKSDRKFLSLKQATPYKPLFRHYFLGKRKMRPKLLPHSVLVQPDTKYYLSAKVYKSFARRRKHHVFQPLQGALSEELTLLSSDAMPDGNLMLDSVVQHYSVDPKATKGEITLRNIYLMDKVSKSSAMSRWKKKQKYAIFADKDLNLTYKVQLQRNPCFGTEALQDSLRVMLSRIRGDYRNLVAACPKGIADSEEAVEIFQQHRMFLLSRYPALTDSSECSSLQETYRKVNAFRDSIANAPCKYVPPVVDENGGIRTGINVQALLEAARTLDLSVARILNSKDAIEKHDITVSGVKLIKEINNDIQTHDIINDEQRAALRVFRKSEAYFQTIIMKS